MKWNSLVIYLVEQEKFWAFWARLIIEIHLKIHLECSYRHSDPPFNLHCAQLIPSALIMTSIHFSHYFEKYFPAFRECWIFLSSEIVRFGPNCFIIVTPQPVNESTRSVGPLVVLIPTYSHSPGTTELEALPLLPPNLSLPFYSNHVPIRHLISSKCRKWIEEVTAKSAFLQCLAYGANALFAPTASILG